MRRRIVAVLLTTITVPVLAAWDLSQLMTDLALTTSGRARFVETRHLALLDRPLVSSGEMRFTTPDRLEKRTFAPRPETVLLDKDRLTIERERQRLSIDLVDQPVALIFVDSMRSALTGNRFALEKNYSLFLAGQREAWVLTLLPNDPAMATIVQRITISGQRNRIRRIEYLQADGDRVVIQFDPLSEP